MKRTLTLSLFLGLVASAMAQTPTVVEKPLPKSASGKSAAQGAAPNTKPAVANVKVIAVPATASKPSAVVAKQGNAKPAVIAVQSRSQVGSGSTTEDCSCAAAESCSCPWKEQRCCQQICAGHDLR